MKFKSLIIPALCLSAVAFTSCDGEKEATYVPAQPVEVPEVYFSLSDDSTFMNLGDTDTKVDFTLYRKDTKGTITTPLSYSATMYNAKAQNPTKQNAERSLFQVPSSVTFADGENSTVVTMTLDPTQLNPDNIYEVTFKVGASQVTPYFSQVLTYKFKFNPFVDVVGPNGETRATLLDFVMTTWFNVPKDTEFEVTLQKSPAINGLYRLVNPYGLDYPYNEEADVDGKVHYLYFNCANPKAVFLCNASGDPLEADGTFPIYYTGMSWNWTDYGEVLVTGMYNFRAAQGNMTEANKWVGTLSDGTLTFPEKSFVARMDIYTAAGSWSYAGTNGFCLRWPGVSAPEPEPEPEPEPGEWVGIGDCEFTDPFIYPLFQISDPQTYDVEVEKSTSTAGLFRMVNPYKDGVMPDGQDYDGDLYIEIDCTNPDVVTVALQNTGFEDQKEGPVWICNYGFALQQYSGKDADYVISAGYNDTYFSSTYTISLKGKNALFNFPEGDKPNDLNTSSIKIDGQLVMNDQAAAQAKFSIATARVQPKYFKQLLKNAGFVDKKVIRTKHAYKQLAK